MIFDVVFGCIFVVCFLAVVWAAIKTYLFLKALWSALQFLGVLCGILVFLFVFGRGTGQQFYGPLCGPCSCYHGLKCADADFTDQELDFHDHTFSGFVDFSRVTGLRFEWFSCQKFSSVRKLSLVGTGITCEQAHIWRKECGLRMKIWCDSSPRVTVVPVLKNGSDNETDFRFSTPAPIPPPATIVWTTEKPTSTVFSGTDSTSTIVSTTQAMEPVETESDAEQDIQWLQVVMAFVGTVAAGVTVEVFRRLYLCWRLRLAARRGARMRDHRNQVRWSRFEQLGIVDSRPRRPIFASSGVHPASIAANLAADLAVGGSSSSSEAGSPFITPAQSPKPKRKFN